MPNYKHEDFSNFVQLVDLQVQECRPAMTRYAIQFHHWEDP